MKNASYCGSSLGQYTNTSAPPPEIRERMPSTVCVNKIHDVCLEIHKKAELSALKLLLYIYMFINFLVTYIHFVYVIFFLLYLASDPK